MKEQKFICEETTLLLRLKEWVTILGQKDDGCLKMLNTELQSDPDTPLLSVYPRQENKSTQKLNSQKVEITQTSINWLMEKQDVVYPYDGIVFDNKNKILIPSTMWMNFKKIISNRIQTQKTTY